MLADFGSNAGWWIKAEVEDNHAFYIKTMGLGNGWSWKFFIHDIMRLDPTNPQITIEKFKEKWEIQDLKELYYKDYFSIVDNQYVQK